MVSITVPAAYTGSVADSNAQLDSGAGSSPDNPINTGGVSAQLTYVFDAVLSLDHNQSLTKTMHPVQNGAAITSHAYLNPATLTMYVLMSDVLGQYVTASQTTTPYIQQWTGNSSKSVSAYLQLLKLQAARIPLTVTTRLRTYGNMLIADVSPREDSKSIAGARFRVEFSEIFIAGVQDTPTSARPNDTDNTSQGAVGTTPPSNTVNTQFQVPTTATGNTLLSSSTGKQTSSPTPVSTKVNVPGAGTYTSTPQQFTTPPGAFGGGSGGGGASGSF